MSLAVHHLAIVVPDLHEAERFYLELLELPLLRRHTDGAGRHRATWLSLGSSFLALELGARGEAKRDSAPGLHCLALGIEPQARAALERRLAEAGFPKEKETAFTFYVRDPVGTLIGFSHFPNEREGAVG